MLKTRIIPSLLLKNESLVKTIKFNKYGYIGDPVNTVRIFNELEVDELIFLDIRATLESRGPNFKILSEISNECFMPLSYGGGITKFEEVKKIFSIGIEKVAVNSAVTHNTTLIKEIAEHFGSQSLIVSIDVKKNFWGKYEVYSHSGTRKIKKDPVEWAQEVQEKGAGEILLTSIDKEGTWNGFDLEIIRKVTEAVNIPVIAQGGAAGLHDIRAAVKESFASAVALGNMVVYQKQGMGVLVNFPAREELEQTLS